MLLVYGLSRAAVYVGAIADSRALLVSAVLLVAFVAIEARGRFPLMPLRIFANRNRSGSMCCPCHWRLSVRILFMLTLYLQNVLGFSPLQAGFAFLPTALGVVVGAARLAHHRSGRSRCYDDRTAPRGDRHVRLSAITPHASYARMCSDRW